MPELPEVESTRQHLHAAIVGHTIARAQLHRPDYLTVIDPPTVPRLGVLDKPCSTAQDPRPNPQDLSSHLLQSQRITTTSRKGKQLAIHTAEGPILLLQLGMSGEVQIHQPPTPRATALPPHGTEQPYAPPNLRFADLRFADWGLPPHTHATWQLSNHTLVHFTDPRRFGHLTWFPNLASLIHHRWQHLGPDALTITPAQLAEALAQTTRATKPALLDQSLLAGVGNIYADEALHLAAIHPKRPAHRLKPHETDRLAHAITTILAAAVRAGGSTIATYRSPTGDPGNHQLAHRVYARGTQPCPTCTTPLKAETLAQRTTTWCPTCQPFRPKRARPRATGFPPSEAGCPCPPSPEIQTIPSTIHTRFTTPGQLSAVPPSPPKSRPSRPGVHSF
jgi:formamidopyrimidine-DNA glycosylase